MVTVATTTTKCPHCGADISSADSVCNCLETPARPHKVSISIVEELGSTKKTAQESKEEFKEVIFFVLLFITLMTIFLLLIQFKAIG